MGEKVDKYMMATKAMHKLGDISSDIPDLCHIHEIGKEHYIGNWVTGFGFINVKFPKDTTRELTEEEVRYYNTRSIQIGSGPLMKLKVD